MAKYRIRYADNDPCCPGFSLTVEADDRQEAEEIFYEDEDGDGGWVIQSITKVPRA